MIEVKCKEFDYDIIADSGQAFRMYPGGVCIARDKKCRVINKCIVSNVTNKCSVSSVTNNTVIDNVTGGPAVGAPVATGGPAVGAPAEGGSQVVVGAPAAMGDYVIECPDEDNDFWRHYFDLDTDYAKYIESIDPEDKYLSDSADFGRGIRILNQDPWEMLITFIISQRKNIPAIRSSVEAICKRWGTEMDGYFAFPSPSQLAKASLEELRSCSLGYRDEYIYLASGFIAENPGYLESLRTLDYDALTKELMKFKGVGIKVANCVALFGYHKIDAFPVDVWIQRALDRYYPCGFPFERYQGYAGIMQQYIFYYIRKNG